MIDPVTSQMFLVSKGDKAILFEVPSASGTLKEEFQLKGIKEPITGCDISQDGSDIILVGTDNMFLFKRESGESVQDAMEREPKNIGASVKGQCEAVTFESKDRDPGFFSITEGSNEVMHFFKRK